MTSISAALFAFTSDNTSSTSAASGNSALFESFFSQQAQGTTGTGSGQGSFGLSLFSGGTGMCNSASDSGTASSSASGLSGSSQGTSNFEEMIFNLSASTSANTAATDTSGDAGTSTASSQGGLDQLFAMMQQMMTSIESDLENIGSGSTTTQAASTDSASANSAASSDNLTSFAENALANGGPLPQFLAHVDTQMNLNSTQQQALQNIANEYQNADASQTTVQSIAGALQQAGI